MELGILVWDCGCLARDLRRIFRTYWQLGEMQESTGGEQPIVAVIGLLYEICTLISEVNIQTRWRRISTRIQCITITDRWRCCTKDKSRKCSLRFVWLIIISYDLDNCRAHRKNSTAPGAHGIWRRFLRRSSRHSSTSTFM